MKVKLDDVIQRITGNEDRFNTDLEYYVGGEHYECGALAIYEPGLLDSDKGKILGFKFHFPFKAGDVLFMARNPHLKKAAVVMFDGICSDASYVLRTKDEMVLRQKFLPLLIQNELFWRFFEKNKSGSVNYLMNWKEMKKYEFYLPSPEVQDEIIEKAWSIEHLKKKYLELDESLDVALHARFIDMYSDSDKWKKKKLSDAFTLQMGKTPARKNHSYWGGDQKWISIADLGNYEKYTDDTKEMITTKAVNECNIKVVPENTVLMSFKLSIGKTAITSEDIFTNEAIMAFIRKNDEIQNEYLRSFLRFKDWSEEARYTVKGITLNKNIIGRTLIPIPPSEVQSKYTDYVLNIETSKSNIKYAVENLEILMRTEVYQQINKEV